MHKKPKLVLASGSPRRVALLSQWGIHFEKKVANIDESVNQQESPADYVKRLSREKALSIAKELEIAHNYYVLGADTTVVLGKCIFGKPADVAEATSHLSLLQGKTHEVLTGVCLIKIPGNVILLEVFSTLVTMKSLTAVEIRDYIKTGEPMDKAGSYAVQGLGGRLIQKIEGSLNNVIGLPVELIIPTFKKIGLLT